MVKKILFMGKEQLLFNLYKEAIDERNSFQSENQYELMKGEDGPESNPFIQFIHYGTHYDLPYLEAKLRDYPELKALIFIKPTEHHVIGKINQLMLDYPLAVLGITELPIQPARLWTFLSNVESKTLHFEWEDGDWDEF